MSIKEFREDASKDSESRPPSFHKNRQNEKRIKTQLAKTKAKETSEEALSRNPILSQFMTAQDLSSKEVLFYLKQFTQKRENTTKRIKATHGIDDEDMLVQDGMTRKVTPMEHNSSDDESSNEYDDISTLNNRNRRKRRILAEDEDVEVKEEEEDDDEEEEEEEEETGRRNWRTRGQKKLFVAQEEVEKERREQIEETELLVGRSGHFQDEIDGYSLETDPYRPRNLHLLPTTQSMLDGVADDPDNLEDVDDEELNDVILDEDAVRLKERIWIGINEDYLLEQENKRLKEEADQLAGNTSNKKRRTGAGRSRKRNNAQDLPVVHTAVGVMSQLEDKSGLQAALRAAEESGDLTTADSVKNMLQKASFSRKINYDAIDGLFNTSKPK